MKSINLKTQFGVKAYYEAVKCAFQSGHIVTTIKGASNYAEWLLTDPSK